MSTLTTSKETRKTTKSIGTISNEWPSYYPPFDTNRDRSNAIIYMAQKSHKVYLRDSLALLQRSLDLLFHNYLLLDDHFLNVTVFIFHTGDFDHTDLLAFESRYPPKTRGTMLFVNLLDTPYWQIPSHLKNSADTSWQKHPGFNLGYRHMIRWYALRVWDYFQEINTHGGFRFRYIMRMDEESFFHSPIQYDLFGYMSSNSFQYAFRICSYEMNAIKQIIANYTTNVKSTYSKNWSKIQEFNGGSCGFYNNWFIGELSFFRTERVQHLLNWFDLEGFMYRDRLNDLVIQTAAVYSNSQPSRIHRFLDWSYEHFTFDKSSGCPLWGALETGYTDTNAETLVHNFVKALPANCPIENDSVKRQMPRLHVMNDSLEDLSPVYQHHIPLSIMKTNQTLLSIKAGRIDLKGRGEASGGVVPAHVQCENSTDVKKCMKGLRNIV